eukprot:snap_masked-scaffold_3-processed-gene-16.52-mRNA-1 protein AED:1.00 eAED:1.00 QI:0/0/0/0/1/1/2/0/64
MGKFHIDRLSVNQIRGLIVVTIEVDIPQWNVEMRLEECRAFSSAFQITVLKIRANCKSRQISYQ